MYDNLQDMIKYNDVESVKKFIKKNIPISQHTINYTAKKGNFEILKLLLSYKNFRVERNVIDYTIDWSAEIGHFEIVKYLLENNTPCSKNAIKLAAQNGHFEIVKLLLENNKPCTARAINFAIQNGHYSIVKLLLSHGKEYSPQYKLFVEEISKHDFS